MSDSRHEVGRMKGEEATERVILGLDLDSKIGKRIWVSIYMHLECGNMEEFLAKGA